MHVYHLFCFDDNLFVSLQNKNQVKFHSVYLENKKSQLQMYQQKFMPYNQMNQVYEEEEFQEEDSQPLIEQVDPNYQPNEKEVRQYAIQILGMNLPEDQRLIYLARQGLKAPIPANWQPFQGRDGEVYYKHKITQQKTYEHPTDVQYRKRYTQQKERAARKNLKSMNLKSNPLSGFGQPLGQPSFGSLGSKIGINPLGLSNFSSDQHQAVSKEVSKLDHKIEEQLRNQVDQLEQKLQRDFEQFQEQRKTIHQKNMKKYKSDFENSLSQIKSEKSSTSSYEKALKQQKQRIKIRLKEAYDDRFKDEFADVEKGEEKKLNEFVQLYEEDNKIKIKKYENQKEREFNQRVKKLQISEKRHEENKLQKEKQRQRVISQIKETYQKEGNQQIEEATRETFNKQLRSIKESHGDRIRQFEQKLQEQFQEMNKLLGHDPNKALQQLAEKRNRLKKISEQKLQSLKKKEYQKVNQNYSQTLSQQIEQMKSLLEVQNARQIQSHKITVRQKLQTLKSKLQTQTKETLTNKVEQLYSQMKRSTSQYEKTKNKKILDIRDKFISEIMSKGEGKNEELNLKLGLREKEEMIENKEELINSLGRQVELETFVLKELKMNKIIATSTNLDHELKKLMADLSIVYKPDAFFKHEKKFNQRKQKYKADKQLLGSMMAQLQNNTFLPFYHQKHSSHQPTTSTTAILVKQYNTDVRLMRDNQEMLAKYELTLRKAEFNDQTALSELQNSEFVYEDISLRNHNQVQRLNNEPKLQQIDHQSEYFNGKKVVAQPGGSYQSVEDRLTQHTKFLSNVKTELNRKLYQVRNNNYFRV